ncbi:FAD-binding oxidoreductase [Thermasporomyces composti]|jgi:glycolate oxidase|uniref:Glycolate oxidase n=1 Tax=Thermasporomyces composti TaxID=696763 RepID=A0A3D9V826_THECX|nr:FAD-linked oxidase C-terminal domain-containing protein [Thermasporomyces composti]REF37619.1 glycolate oxidase [Thermasporomyces composti]
MVDALADALRAQIPAPLVVTDPDRLASYRHDMATFCPSGMPAVAVLARETAHVQHVLKVASDLGVPVVPQGGRTGLSGGANAVDGCIVLSLAGMDRILEIDPANRVAVVEPGVLNAVLSKAAAEQGLFYPPDPSSWEISTVGGNIATNAGGLCCVKYGVTADFVRALEVVLANGEILHTGRRTAKGVAGYDLTRLFVGSEGTLGVITRATLALRPAAEEPRTVAALFPSVAAAGEAVARVVASGLVPSLLEFMDQASLRAANEYRRMGLPDHAAAMLIAQSDAGPERAAAEIATIARHFADAGGFDVIEAEDAQEGELLLNARREAHYAIDRLGSRLIDDVCVPVSRLADFVQRVEKVAADLGLTIPVVGHAGDGNLHPNVVFDATDEDQVRRARQAFDEIMRIGLALGGTITGEHGVGLLKRDWLERELGHVGLRIHRELKRVFDPAGILNPGKVMSLEA